MAEQEAFKEPADPKLNPPPSTGAAAGPLPIFGLLAVLAVVVIAIIAFVVMRNTG